MINPEFHIEESKRSLGRIITLVISLGFVVLLTVGAYFYTKVNQAASSDSVPTSFTVAKGASTRAIGRALSDQKIINSYWSFVLYVKLHQAGDKIQAGNYVLDRDMSIAEIVDVLTAGKVISNDRKVTIIEGRSNKQIAADLESRNIVSSRDFTGALASGNFVFKYNDIAKPMSYQGFLFPDTYVVAKDATAQQLIQKMLANFESKISDELEKDIADKNLNIKNTVILASIIEKEVGRNTSSLTADDIAQMQRERELVASVFYNRLSIGMALESDATVNYITGKTDRSVTIADTKIKSPYNTYQVRGLPPAPISNPGLGSLRAAINPADTDYIYFLNAPDGTAYFAKTLEEHNLNRQKYLR
ncbi:MAG: endolytic transglycosylase MltG [Candidatus Doudnabacteria bacterium]|nr:endolytic transglycosylase MltG [Candidatus Doudnabacteria bacterium]